MPNAFKYKLFSSGISDGTLSPSPFISSGLLDQLPGQVYRGFQGALSGGRQFCGSPGGSQGAGAGVIVQIHPQSTRLDTAPRSLQNPCVYIYSKILIE